MFSRVLADARDNPVVEPYHAHWRHAADVLGETMAAALAAAGRCFAPGSAWR